MSSDNGIYILEAKDGFRVIHAQAIENLYWWDDGERKEINPERLVEYFGEEYVIPTRERAFNVASLIYRDLKEKGIPIEYGISFIESWKDKDFPSKNTIVMESVPLDTSDFDSLGIDFDSLIPNAKEFLSSRPIIRAYINKTGKFFCKQHGDKQNFIPIIGFKANKNEPCDLKIQCVSCRKYIYINLENRNLS